MTRYPIIRAAVRFALLMGGASAFTLGTSTAFAQEQNAAKDKPIEEVVVTGSRIVSSLDSPSPVQSLTAEDIEHAGIINTQELLLKNPTMGTPTLSRTNSAFLTSGAGVATIDLRNLGIDRTLVLVNGRRFVSGLPGSMAVDLNTIPTQFIEKTEILTGGASAVYGSDAVAGVVNFIYKSDYEGVRFDGQHGASAESDNEETQFGMTFGTNTESGRGNIMAHVGYTKQGAVMSRDRERSAIDQASTGAGVTGDPEQLFDITRPFYSSFAPAGRFYTANSPAGINTSSFSFDQAGNAIRWDTNGATTAATGFNRSYYRSIAVPVERYLFAGRGTFEVAENHKAFFEGTYASTNSGSEIEPFALAAEDISPGTGGQIPIEQDINGTLVRNPLVPDVVFNNAADEDGDGLRDFYFTKRMADFGTRNYTARRDTFRVVGGVEGSFLENKWRYDAFYSFGQTKEAQRGNGQVNVLNFWNALNSVQDVEDWDGDSNTTEAICYSATARAQGCVPVSVFGYNSISPQAKTYIEAPSSLTTFTRQRLIGANITGELFDMPAGPFAIAAGAEYREERAESAFDALQQAGLNGGNAIPPTAGEFDVREVFVEASVPLLKDLPAVDSLQLRAAVRASDYSTVGNTMSWNGALEWGIVPSLRMRITRSQSTRAPNINDLYSPPSQTFPTGVQDPCLGVTLTSADAVSVACRAAPGVVSNITDNIDVDNPDGVFNLTQADFQGISGFDRGNPALSEEEGNSWTIGAVFQPEGVPVLENFQFSLDYYRIDIANAITLRDRNFILSQCYGGGDASLCQFVTRRPNPLGANSAGSIEFLDADTTNTGGEFAEGVDLTVQFQQQIGAGKFGATLAYTHLLDHYLIPLTGGDKDQLGGEVGDSEDRAYLTLGYDVGKFGFNLNTTYISSADLDDQFLAAFELEPGSVGIGSVIYLDAQVRFSPSDAYEVYLGANNLLDEEPPLLITGLPSDVTGTETDSGTYDAIGRRWYAGVRVKF